MSNPYQRPQPEQPEQATSLPEQPVSPLPGQPTSPTSGYPAFPSQHPQGQEQDTPHHHAELETNNAQTNSEQAHSVPASGVQTNGAQIHDTQTSTTAHSPETSEKTEDAIASFSDMPVTWTFIGICCVVYFLMFLDTHSIINTVGGYTYVLDQRGRFLPVRQDTLGWDLILDSAYVRHRGEWWRIFTSSVVHLNLLHILMNCIMLYYLGMMVEKVYGKFAMFCTIIIGAAGGALACMLNAPHTAVGGASTVVYALFALLVAISMQEKTSLAGPLTMIGVNLGFSVISSGVSLWGHIGGLLAGAVLGFIYYSPDRQETEGKVSPGRTMLAFIVTVIVSILTVHVGVNKLS